MEWEPASFQDALPAAGGDPGTETIQRSAADADEGLVVGSGPIWKGSASGVPGNSRATCLVSSSIRSTSGTLSLRTVPTQRKPVAGTVSSNQGNHQNTVATPSTAATAEAMPRREFLELMEPGALKASPVLAASALAFAALQAVAALPEYRSSALGRLGRTEEAEAEARRAYKTEQGRRWYKHNPHGADAIAAATKAADATRKRTEEYLLAARLEQLRERVAVRSEAAVSAPWTDRLPELTARPLDGDATGAVIA